MTSLDSGASRQRWRALWCHVCYISLCDWPLSILLCMDKMQKVTFISSIMQSGWDVQLQRTAHDWRWGWLLCIWILYIGFFFYNILANQEIIWCQSWRDLCLWGDSRKLWQQGQWKKIMWQNLHIRGTFVSNLKYESWDCYLLMNKIRRRRECWVKFKEVRGGSTNEAGLTWRLIKGDDQRLKCIKCLQLSLSVWVKVLE